MCGTNPINRIDPSGNFDFGSVLGSIGTFFTGVGTSINSFFGGARDFFSGALSPSGLFGTGADGPRFIEGMGPVGADEIEDVTVMRPTVASNLGERLTNGLFRTGGFNTNARIEELDEGFALAGTLGDRDAEIALSMSATATGNALIGGLAGAVVGGIPGVSGAGGNAAAKIFSRAVSQAELDAIKNTGFLRGGISSADNPTFFTQGAFSSATKLNVD
jgi:hypothetical protein